MARPTERGLQKQAAIASVVMVLAALGWLGGLALGGSLGLAPRFAILLDLCAMAAFAWSAIVLFRVWRARQDDGSQG
ncbi:MAG: DUF5337 family protein [Pseudomonadota bacterium]